jgi:hypothetical protein
MSARRNQRSGGRILELVWGFALVALCAALLLAAIAAPIALFMYAAPYVDPTYLGIGLTAVIAPFVERLAKLAWKLGAALWRPFLKCYNYEPHTLRPREDEGQ